MTKTFSDIDLENDYYQTMKQTIEKKVEGEDIVGTEEEEPETSDIMAALKESIDLRRLKTNNK